MGDLVIASDALRGEGISYYYLLPSREVSGDTVLVATLASGCERNGSRHHMGTTWTTDALFREMIEEVKRYVATLKMAG